MLTAQAKKIFKNIDSEEVDMEKKLIAIQDIAELKVHNDITKQEMLNAMKWLLEFCVI